MYKPTAVLTEQDVLSILNQLARGITHRSIAQAFGISCKTVSRISTGETWKEVSQRYAETHPVPILTLPAISLTALPTDFCDLMDEIVAVKNTFALSFDQPIYWGWFEGWDGLHSIISDGYIIWESIGLVDYAQKLARSPYLSYPVWAAKAEELPTFELEDIMSQPTGAILKLDVASGDTVRLAGANNQVFLKRKHYRAAMNMGLDIRLAGKSTDFVYLTKNKPRAISDPTPIVIGCATTLK